jgi:LPS O-antigen subunit length determinant protein (WzzB/FepE family)
MKQESSGFIEVCLRLINSNLRHFWLCASIVIIPTLAVFALVMWVIEPTYRSKAIVTPPSASKTSLQGLGSLLGGASGGLSSLLGF